MTLRVLPILLLSILSQCCGSTIYLLTNTISLNIPTDTTANYTVRGLPDEKDITFSVTANANGPISNIVDTINISHPVISMGYMNVYYNETHLVKARVLPTGTEASIKLELHFREKPVRSLGSENDIIVAPLGYLDDIYQVKFRPGAPSILQIKWKQNEAIASVGYFTFGCLGDPPQFTGYPNTVNVSVDQVELFNFDGMRNVAVTRMLDYLILTLVQKTVIADEDLSNSLAYEHGFDDYIAYRYINADGTAGQPARWMCIFKVKFYERNNRFDLLVYPSAQYYQNVTSANFILLIGNAEQEYYKNATVYVRDQKVMYDLQPITALLPSYEEAIMKPE